MASYDGGHMNEEQGNYHAPDPIHNDHQSRQQNTREEQQQLPTAVEAVITFGYPPDLVLSVYQQLARSTRLGDSQGTVSVPGSESAHVTGSNPSRDVVSASTLMVAVDDAIVSQSSSPAGIVTGDVGFNFSVTMAAEGSSGDVEDLAGERYGDGGGQFTGPDNDDGMQPSIQHSSADDTQHLQLASNTPLAHGHSSHQVVHSSTHSHTEEQTSAAINQSSTSSSSQIANSPSQPSNHNWSSTRSQTVTGNQSSTSNYTERVTSSSMETVISTSSSTQVQGDSDITSALTSSGVTTSRSTESPGNRSSEEPVMSESTQRFYPNSFLASVQEDSARAVVGHHGTQSVTSNPHPDIRSRDRMPANEEPIRGRRRHQLDRLRALRAENRRLKARQNCRHCRLRPVALTLLPCGHFTFCEECGSSFQVCPLCHKTILADVRTFLS